MAENSKISQIKLPNGSTYDIKDNTSGYTNNTGTITSIKTTEGAHTVIDVSSGAAQFNVPTKTSHLTNDSGFLTSYTETDPTVPSWAKQSSKPTYTAEEVGALPITGGTITTNGLRVIGSFPDNSQGTGVDIGGGKIRLQTTINSNYPYITLIPTALGMNIANPDVTAFVYESSSSNGAKLTLGFIMQRKGVLELYGSSTGTTQLSTLASSGTKKVNLPDANGTIALTSDIPDTSSFLTSETDPVFSASAAASITSTDISNWNAKVSDDKTWNGVELNLTSGISSSEDLTFYIPGRRSVLDTTAYQVRATSNPSTNRIAKYDVNSYLYSTTPSANDNSMKVATTAYVDAAIPKVYSSTNTGGYLTMATLPIYDGTVV